MKSTRFYTLGVSFRLQKEPSKKGRSDLCHERADITYPVLLAATLF